MTRDELLDGLNDVRALLGVMLARAEREEAKTEDAEAVARALAAHLGAVEAASAALTPRALSKSEVLERKPFTLWVEDLDTGAQVFRVVRFGDVYQSSPPDWLANLEADGWDEAYDRRWRFWTDRPTNRQRREEAWQRA